MEHVFDGRTVLAVLLYASAAAAAAALGVLPFLRRSGVPPAWIGGAYAIASGLMLGASYILMTEAIVRAVWPAILGALIGALATRLIQTYAGADDTPRMASAAVTSTQVVRVMLLGALHSASEGVAIGVAMLVRVELGIFLALAFGLHNVAEATVLVDLLRRVGITLRHAAALAVITNVSMVLLAVVAFAVTPAIPGLLPWMLGLTSGSLVFLVMTELMPYAYERASRTGVALLVSIASGGVVLLRGLFVGG